MQWDGRSIEAWESTWLEASRGCKIAAQSFDDGEDWMMPTGESPKLGDQVEYLNTDQGRKAQEEWGLNFGFVNW